MNLLEQMHESVISGSEDLQPLSLECTGTAQKYIGTSMDEFFDSHPLPTNINEVDCQSNGKNLHFSRSIEPTNIKREVSDSLDYTNSFWNFNWMVKNLNWMVPHLPTCRLSVKRISVNFALLCLSDIMIKILKESQFTVESESHGERLLLIFDASKMGSWLPLNEYLKLMDVILFEKGTRSQFDLRPQHFRLPRTYLFRDLPSKKGTNHGLYQIAKPNDKVTSNRITTQ